MNEGVKIARAKPEDALQIQNLFKTTWLATYPNSEAGITVDDIEDSFRKRFTEEELLENQGENGEPAGESADADGEGNR